MKNYVISLKGETKRREHIKDEFRKYSVPFEFHDAVTPTTAISLAQELQLQFDEAHLAETELACLMSHVQLWQRMLDDNVPYIAIFEDDIYLGENANSYLSQSTWIQPEWHIIDIEYFDKRLFVGKQQVTLPVGNRRLLTLHGPNLGAAGYILSQKAARNLLTYIRHQTLTPLDKMVFNDYIHQGNLPIHYMHPSLVIQEMKLYPESTANLPSKLFQDRKQRMQTHKTKGSKKMHKELTRVYLQIKRLFFARKARFQ